MRILMLSSSYPRYPGETTAPFIEEIAAGVAARGHTVHLAAPWHPELQRGPEERGVHLHFFRYAPHPALNVWGYAQSMVSDTSLKGQTLAVTPFALAASVRALLQVVRRESRAVCQLHSAPCDPSPPFDLIHAHWVLPNGVPAALVARRLGLPLVISLHGNDVFMAEHYWPTTLPAGLALRSAAAVTACSSDLHRRGLCLGASATSSHVIPYGVNVEEFRPDPRARQQVRAELNLSEDMPLVVALGRLVYKKGFSVLLDSWPQVLARHPRALLVLVGYGDLRESLEQQSYRLGIAHRVRFTGRLERARAAAYIAAANVFALPIVRNQGADGLPNALLEAMGAGRPIVASRVAGVPDVIEDGQHGLIVPDRDPAALAEAITRLLSDSPLAEQFGAAARQRIETELTWEHTAARFERVYRSLGTENREQ
jgi:glycosyltransferase involved in cell wall biosynthesis